MKVVITYNGQIGGHSVFLEDAGRQLEVAVVNGNRSDARVPVVMLSLDANMVYAMSQPTVISRILTSQPQLLLTSRDLSHRLFEHGMRASLSRQMMGNSPVTATMDTYYKLATSAGPISLLVLPDGGLAMSISKEVLGKRCSRNFVLANCPMESHDSRVVVLENLGASVCSFEMDDDL
jgi:hypothetical protein